MKIEMVNADKLKLLAGNPRVLSEIERHKIEISLREFDLVEPLVVNSATGEIIGGNQRYQIGLAAGRKQFPVIFLDLTEAETMTLSIALNRHKGEWHKDKLRALLGEFFDPTDKRLEDIFDEAEIKNYLSLAGEKEDIAARQLNRDNRNQVKDAKLIYDNPKEKQIVFYFLEDEFDQRQQQIQKVIEGENLSTTADTLLFLLNKYGSS